MVTRRQVVIVLAAAVTGAFDALAQSQKVRRIGFLGNSTAALEANLVGPFRQGLRDLGYVEGRNCVIEFRWAEGNYARLPQLAAELAALEVEVIVTAGTPAALAVQRSAATIPLVMVAVGDPVGTHLVASLALPGGNSTGLTSIAPDLEGKRLELLSEIVPRLSRVSILLNPANPFHVKADSEVHAAGRQLGVRIHSVGVRTAAELDRAFDAIADEHPDAFIMLADRVFLHNRKRIVNFAAQHRIPAAYAYRELVEAGGLMSFGPNYADMHRRAARYVDKILKGANPGELPIELPTKFELVINVGTARALGLSMPPTVLVRADELID
jgi:putative ABC transport system substrate-binding protein